MANLRSAAHMGAMFFVPGGVTLALTFLIFFAGVSNPGTCLDWLVQGPAAEVQPGEYTPWVPEGISSILPEGYQPKKVATHPCDPVGPGVIKFLGVITTVALVGGAGYAMYGKSKENR